MIKGLFVALLRLGTFLFLYLLLDGLYWSSFVRPIPTSLAQYLVPQFIGAPANANPLALDQTGQNSSTTKNQSVAVAGDLSAVDTPIGASKPASSNQIPQNPFMAKNGNSNMHGDSYATDTHNTAGPLGINPQIISTSQNPVIGGQCTTVAFDSRGRIETLCIEVYSTSLVLLDPLTLKEIARHNLPGRPVNRTLDVRKIVKDTSGGAYFYLDNQDRAVVALSDNTIKIVAQRNDGNTTRFYTEMEYDLSPALGTGDNKITTVLPDWKGNYWFVTRFGIVGIVSREGGNIKTITLGDEEIQNTFAIDEEATYIVTDYALYRMEVDPSTGKPQVIWREAYDRGTRIKPGQINQGSGTTPTLFGNGYVAITDNADPLMNVLVYKRDKTVQGDRLICQQPVFKPYASATENSLIGYRNSLIVENNYGYDTFLTMLFGKTSEPGISRVDIDPSSKGCSVKWTSPLISQTVVAKLSLGSGLVYVYTKEPSAPPLVDAFYLGAIDFETGKTAFQILTGTGFRYDNNYAPITIGPNGTAYIGSINGLIAVRDGNPPSTWETFNQKQNSFITLGLGILSAMIVWGAGKLLRWLTRSKS